MMHYTELMKNTTPTVDVDEYRESVLEAMAQEPDDESNYTSYALSPQIQSAADLDPASPDFGPAASAASLDTAIKFLRAVELFDRGLNEATRNCTYPYVAGLGSSLRYSAPYYPFYWSLSGCEKENIASECVYDLTIRFSNPEKLYQDFLSRRLMAEKKLDLLSVMNRAAHAVLERERYTRKKQKKHFVDNVVQTAAGEVSLFDQMSAAEDVALNYEKKEAFYETLEHFNPDDRKIFDLLCVGDKKKQIAKEMKRSPGYVSKHANKIHKAFEEAGLL